ncbi:MAG: hypothetical protein IPP13_08650 [Kouleothrix sp.]|jgi:hypothetical protein|nr:hypothetical protein [Kouleothrix sp.]
MAIVWVEPGEHSVFAALEAVEWAVERHEQAAQLDERFMGDAYLAENIGQMRASWSLDLWRVVAGSGSALGRAFELGQRAARKLTWWYGLPQLQQVSEFHGAAVRSTDAIITHLHHLTSRLQAIEGMHSEQRLRSIEGQLRAMRDEQHALTRRIAELEDELRRLNAQRES